MLKTPVMTMMLTLLLLVFALFTSNDSLGQERTSSVDEETSDRLSAISIATPSRDQETIQYFRDLGEGAFTVIEEALVSTDVHTRRRGLIAMTYLLKPREHRDEEYGKRERAMISMLLPLLNDKEPIIRKNVTGFLGGFSWSEYPDVNPQVAKGLVKMLSDEDESIREYAADFLIRIGRGSDVPEALRNRPDRLTID